MCEYLQDHPCVDCGNTDIVVLEFDHVRGKKANNISYLVKRGYAWHTIYSEIQKCDVRCANCHRKKTAQQFNTYKYSATNVQYYQKDFFWMVY